MSAPVIALACVLGLAASTPSTERGLLLERIVAVVDNQTVSQAELAAEARLALARRTEAPEASAQAPLEAAMLHDFLSYLIGQMLVAREARRVGAQEVHGAEIDVAYARFVDTFRNAGTYDVWLRQAHLSPGFVRDVLRREQTVERYLGQRLRTRLASVGQPGEERDDGLARRNEALRTFLPGYLAELRQTVEVRRLTPGGVLEREPRP